MSFKYDPRPSKPTESVNQLKQSIRLQYGMLALQKGNFLGKTETNPAFRSQHSQNSKILPFHDLKAVTDCTLHHWTRHISAVQRLGTGINLKYKHVHGLSI